VQETATYIGPESSNDSQLSGTLETHIDLLINTGTGVGEATGTYTLRDASTGTLKQTGQFVEATAGDALKGFIIGRLSGGGKLLANFSAKLYPGMVVKGELGSNAVVPVDLATIRTGTCGESYE
jgi:hypothetical protein